MNFEWLRFNDRIKWIHFGRYTLQLHIPSWSFGHNGDWYIRCVTIIRYFNDETAVGAGFTIMGFGFGVVKKKI